MATAMMCSLFPSSMTLSSIISNNRFSSIHRMKYEAKLLASSGLREDIGFCPVKSSTRTTPKLVQVSKSSLNYCSEAEQQLSVSKIKLQQLQWQSSNAYPM
ncbi:hypothetical protein CR513_53424, partial [Mucuna pruriens]